MKEQEDTRDVVTDVTRRASVRDRHPPDKLSPSDNDRRFKVPNTAPTAQTAQPATSSAVVVVGHPQNIVAQPRPQQKIVAQPRPPQTPVALPRPLVAEHRPLVLPKPKESAALVSPAAPSPVEFLPVPPRGATTMSNVSLICLTHDPLTTFSRHRTLLHDWLWWRSTFA